MDQVDSSRIRLAKVGDLAPGEMKSFQLEGRDPIAVYNVDGQYYATDDFCTHGNASLSMEGLLDGHIVECGWHLGSFDIRTGAPVAPPCQVGLRTYDVVVDGDDICIDLGQTDAR